MRQNGAFELTRCCEIELGIHAQRKQIGGEWGQLPQMAITQTAIFVQTNFNDAWVQALV